MQHACVQGPLSRGPAVTVQVIIGMTSVTLAGAVGSLYWARGPGPGGSEHMPTFPLLTSMKHAYGYQMGSVCFGAFILAFMQFFR